MKTDWLKLKNKYIEDPAALTLEEAAKKFKVNFDVLRRHAAKENWVEDKKLFQNKVQTLRTEKKSEIMASESAQFDSDSLKLARAGYAMIANEMKSNNPLKATVAQIATALANFQKVGKLAFGENPDVDKDITIKVKYDKE